MLSPGPDPTMMKSYLSKYRGSVIITQLVVVVVVIMQQITS